MPDEWRVGKPSDPAATTAFGSDNTMIGLLKRIRDLMGSGQSTTITDGVDTADVIDLATYNALAVGIVDGTGAQITSFGGGTQYTEGDTDATIVGTAVMWEDAANTLRAASAAKALPVTLYDTGGVELAVGGGTQYTEDAAAAANPVGNASILVRADTPGALVTTDGDNVAQRGTNYGAAFTQVVTSAGAFVDTFGGGTQYVEDAIAPADPTGTAMLMTRDDALSAVTEAEGDWSRMRGTANGALWVQEVNSAAIAGTVAGSELQVDIVSSALPSGAATSAKQDTIIGHVDGIEGLLTTIDGDTGNIATLAANIDTNVGLLKLHEDAAHGSGDAGIQALAVRDDALNIRSGTDGDYEPLHTTAVGGLWVTLADTAGVELAVGGGTQYTEDAAAAANPVGNASILVRQDTPGALVTTDGDNVAQRGTNYGAAYTQVVTSAGAFVDTFGGGTQYTEDAAAAANPVGTALNLIRVDTIPMVGITSADGDNVAARGTDKGELYVKHVDAIPVTDNGSTISVDGGIDILSLPNEGQQTMANSISVAVASNQTGIPVTNAGTFAVQVDGAALTSLQLADDVVYVEDAVAPADPSGNAVVMTRDDQLATVTEAEGDWSRLRGTSKGALWVALADSSGDPVTSFGGGTQYTSTDVDATPTGNLIMWHDGGSNTVLAAGDSNPLPISDNGTALRIQDGGGTISIDDGGGVITVDGTVTATIAAGATAIAKAEDSAHASGDVGVPALAIRDDTLNIRSDTEGDYEPLHTNADGALWSLDVNSASALTALQLIDDTVHSGDAALSKYNVIGAVLDDAATATVTENQAHALRMSSRRALLVEGVASGTAINVLDTNSAAIAASLSVLDDWDETDRAKVNLIVGQAGVAAGAGAVAATVQRMTLASDDPAVASLSVLDDWDNAASDGASVSGDVAHDTGDAGEPVKIGAKAIDWRATPTAVTANDRTNLFANRDGILFTLQGHPNTATKNLQITDADGAQTDTDILGAVAANVCLVVTGISVTASAANTTNVSCRIGFGTANTPAADAAEVVLFHPGIPPGGGFGKGGYIIGVGASGAELRVTCDDPVSGSISIDVSYYVSVI